MASMDELFDHIRVERQRQIAKFGDQSHLPDFSEHLWCRTNDLVLSNSFQARMVCDKAFKEGRGSYLHIFAEEVCEAADEAQRGDEAALVEELIQVAAVCVAWLEKLTK